MRSKAFRAFSSVKCGTLIFFVLMFIISSSHPGESIALAQDDLLLLIQKKQKEMKEREDALSRKEERLKALQRDIEERMAKYEKLLDRLETALKKLEHSQEEKIDSVVKAYEVMPPGEAADRLSELPEELAIRILRKMKPKKAGPIMASMDVKKVASLTERMTTIEKIFPAQ